MTGYYGEAALVGVLLFCFFAARKLKAIEVEMKLRIELESEKVKEHIEGIASGFELQAEDAIEDLTGMDPFEAIDIMRQQMLTQVMGWGMNMLMQRFGGKTPPELGVVEYEKPHLDAEL